MYGFVALPSRIVEPLIALSIAYVAIENLVTNRVKPWRLALVFRFGLLHGMGFAGVLSDLGLPRGEFLTALLSFNLGVEAGQLTVIAIAALCVNWYRHRTWYHQRVVVPASLAIAVVGDLLDGAAYSVMMHGSTDSRKHGTNVASKGTKIALDSCLRDVVFFVAASRFC